MQPQQPHTARASISGAKDSARAKNTSSRNSSKRRKSSVHMVSTAKRNVFSPTNQHKLVPGPGTYDLPPLNQGTAASFPPLPKPPPKRKNSPDVSDDELSSRGNSPNSKKRKMQLIVKPKSDDVGPGAYDLPSSFDTSTKATWSPRRQIHGTPRKENRVVDVDLFQASLRPGPGAYNPVSSARGLIGRDRSMRKKLPIERFNPGLYSVLLPKHRGTDL